MAACNREPHQCYGRACHSRAKVTRRMQRVSGDDFSNEGFRWLTGKDVVIFMVPCNAMRVNFVGELG